MSKTYSNTHRFAKRELDILSRVNTDPKDRPLIEEFKDEILALCDKFGNSGQSGGSAPYVAQAITEALGKLLLQKPIAPITGEDEEWIEVSEGMYQNNRCYNLFKAGKEGTPYFLDAIVWEAPEYNAFTGTVEGISSSQYVRSLPFTPKTFYVNVRLRNREFFIPDRRQLEEVFEYFKPLEKQG